MSEKILVPALGESITEATVSKWLKNEGDTVEADEPIVELETDKVNLEVPSPVSGVLIKINSKDGSTVEVGALLGSVSDNGAVSSKIEKNEPEIIEDNVIKLAQEKEIREPEIFDQKQDKTEQDEKPLILTQELKPKKSVSTSAPDKTLSPAVRKIVEEKKLILTQLKVLEKMEES